MTGPAGVAVSVVLSVLSGICSTVKGAVEGEDDPCLAKVTEVMTQFRNDEILRKAKGVSEELRVAQLLMNGLPKPYQLKPDEVTMLSGDVPNNIGVNYLGQLASYMNEEAGKVQNKGEAIRVLKLVNKYCKLSSTREMILIQKFGLLEVYAYGLAYSIQRSVIPGDIDVRKEDLDFVRYPPTVKEAIVASVFNSTDWPVIAKYIKHVKCPHPPQPKPDQRHLPFLQDCCGRQGSVANDDLFRPDICRLTAVGDYWLLYCKQELFRREWLIFKKSYQPPLFALTYFTLDPKTPWVLSNERFVGAVGKAAFEKSTLSSEEYKKRKVTDYNSLKIVITRDLKCLVSTRATPDCFFNIMYLPNTWVSNGGKPYNTIITSRGDPGEDGYWKFDF